MANETIKGSVWFTPQGKNIGIVLVDTGFVAVIFIVIGTIMIYEEGK